MPSGGRNAQRAQARVSRSTGTIVTLLIPAPTAPTTATPFSITQADAPVNLTTATKQNVYAKLHWNSDKFEYGEGGRVLHKVGTLEFPVDWASVVTKAYAVQLADGEILLKMTEALNDSGSAYIVQVESHLNTKE